MSLFDRLLSNFKRINLVRAVVQDVAMVLIHALGFVGRTAGINNVGDRSWRNCHVQAAIAEAIPIQVINIDNRIDLTNCGNEAIINILLAIGQKTHSVLFSSLNLTFNTSELKDMGCC